MDIKAGERITPETIQSLTKYFDKSNTPDIIGSYNGITWLDKTLKKIPFAVSEKLASTGCTIYCFAYKGSVSSNLVNSADFYVRDHTDSSITLTKNQYTWLEDESYYEVLKIEFTIPAITEDSFFYLEVGQNTYGRQYPITVYIDFDENDLAIDTNQVFTSTSKITPFQNISTFVNNANLRHTGEISSPKFLLQFGKECLSYHYYLLGVLDSGLKSYSSFDEIEVCSNIFGDDVVTFKYSLGEIEFIDASGNANFFRIDRIHVMTATWAFGRIPKVMYYRTKTGSTYTDWQPVRVNLVLREYEITNRGDTVLIDPLVEHNWLHQEYLNRLLTWKNRFGYLNFRRIKHRDDYTGSMRYVAFSNLPSGIQNDRLLASWLGNRAYF